MYFNVYCYVYIHFSLSPFQNLAVTVRIINHSIPQNNVVITLTLMRVLATTVAVVNKKCVFVALCIQHAMRTRHFVICGFPLRTIFFHFIT
jgi:hypothetical protein